MIIAIILILSFSAMLLIRNFKNKYTWIFFIKFLGINIIFFSIVLYMKKLSNFLSIFPIENYIFQLLNDIKISFYDLRSLMSVGVSIFLVSKWCFINFTVKRENASIHSSIIKYVLTSLPIMIFLYINSYDFNESMYIWQNTIQDTSILNILNIGKKLIFYLNNIIVFVYILYPFLMLRSQFVKTRIMFKKVQVLVLGISLTLLDLFFVGFFILGPFKDMVVVSGLYEFESLWLKYDKFFYIYLPVTVLIIFDLIFYILIKFKILDRIDIMKKRMVLKNVKLLPNDIRHIFHSYKNTLLSIELLANKAESERENRQGLDAIQEIKVMSRNAMEGASKFLSMFNELTLAIDEINVVNCMNTCLHKCVAPKNIRIVNEICITEAYIFGDYNHITEMFSNLINNSIDAIGKNNGQIRISIDCEADWICILIHDNGCGISKRDIRKIFKPLFSTKKTYKNWGLGLPYVFKVVNAHLGLIFVKSKVNRFTEVQILLPNIRGGMLNE